MDVNQYLKNLLMREGINIESSAVEEIIREIKEKNCYFILDPNNKPDMKDNFSFSMPDGSTINIPNFIFYEAPEVMFQPQLLGYQIMSISQAIIESLQGIDKHYWSDLLSHIVISGGNFSYSGFEERLKLELSSLLPQLGKIPKPKIEEDSKSETKLKLKSLKSGKKLQDTCPHCGILVDLSDDKEYCPSCGGRITLPELSIESGGIPSKANIIDGKVFCPNCNKLIDDSTSIFCPYCGASVQSFDPPEFMAKKINQTVLAKEFSGFYDSVEDVLRYFVPDNLQYAIFNGAAILGSLPSFLRLFVSHQQFTENNDLLYKDISEIF
jgi:actin-related protein